MSKGRSVDDTENGGNDSTYRHLLTICRLTEKYYPYVKEIDLIVFFDKLLNDSENTFKTHLRMHDCITYINHYLGYLLFEIVDYLNFELDKHFTFDIQTTIMFLYDTLSPMTKNV